MTAKMPKQGRPQARFRSVRKMEHSLDEKANKKDFEGPVGSIDFRNFDGAIELNLASGALVARRVRNAVTEELEKELPRSKTRKIGKIVAVAMRRAGLDDRNRAEDAKIILRRVEAWAGSAAKAREWYLGEPIPSLGNRTAESLVNEGRADVVRRYLDHIALGGYA